MVGTQGNQSNLKTAFSSLSGDQKQVIDSDKFDQLLRDFDVVEIFSVMSEWENHFEHYLPEERKKLENQGVLKAPTPDTAS